MNLNAIALALFLLLAMGAGASPFNNFLRGKYFSDGYRWRGLDRRDIIPIAKTIIFLLALLSGVVYELCVLAGKPGIMPELSSAALLLGVFGTFVFSIWSSLDRARRARQRRQMGS